MKILVGYLKPYKWLVILTMVLASVNTIFSLIDPIIFGKIIKLAQDTNNAQEAGTPPVWNGFFKIYFAIAWFIYGNSHDEPYCKKFPRLFCQCGNPKIWSQDFYRWPTTCHEASISGI